MFDVVTGIIRNNRDLFNLGCIGNEHTSRY
jgi:hypothetical protein